MAEQVIPNEQPKNDGGKLSKEEEERLKGEIRRGFATQTYYTGLPKSKKFHGGYWNHGILQIFERQTDALVKDIYYCKPCDEIIFASAKVGTATLNRHVDDHENGKFRIRRIDVVEMLMKAVHIGVSFGQELSVKYFLENLPKPKEKEW